MTEHKPSSFLDRTLTNLRRGWQSIAGSSYDEEAASTRPDLPDDDAGHILEQMRECLENKGGEVSARVRAAALGRVYLALDKKGREKFLRLMAENFGTDGKAPCQSAGHLPKFKLRLYYNKVPRAAEVEAEMQTLFQKMTTDPMIKGILGSTATQRNESINNVRGSIRSKRGHCAGVPPGRHQVELGAPRVDAGGARPPGRARRRGRVGRAWPGVPRPRVAR